MSIEKLVEHLDRLKQNNVDVDIHLHHNLFGDQNIRCIPQIINDDERLGFIVNSQFIYINKRDICKVHLGNKYCYFADSIMSISIKAN